MMPCRLLPPRRLVYFLPQAFSYEHSPNARQCPHHLPVATRLNDVADSILPRGAEQAAYTPLVRIAEVRCEGSKHVRGQLHK